MKVADVMSRRVEYVQENDSVEKVALLIFGRGINGIPVVSQNKKLVGFITEKDILSKFLPSMQEYIEDPFGSSDFESMERKVHHIFELKAEDVMSRKPTVVEAETPLLRAQSLMFTQRVGRLPVVDKKDDLIGIVSQGDIFRALVGDRLLFTETVDYTDWLSKTYYASVDTEDRMKHEIPDLLKVFSENKVKTVVDMGCGTGDHSLELAKRGLVSIGIDSSKAMIEEAEGRRKKLGAEARKRVKFYYGDYEEILPKLKTTFDVVLFLGNTLSDNPHIHKEVIRNAMSFLSEKGVMLFQIHNYEKILKVNKRLWNFNFVRIKDEPGKEYGFLQFYDAPTEHNQTILKTFAILVNDSGKRWKWSGIRNSLRAYLTRQNMEKTLKSLGFSKISFYGGFFDGRKWDYLFREPFKPLESDWLNIIAKK